jgi:hypothetical protein
MWNDKLLNKKMLNDKMANDKMLNNKMSNNKMLNDKMSSIKMLNNKMSNVKMSNGKMLLDTRAWWLMLVGNSATGRQSFRGVWRNLEVGPQGAWAACHRGDGANPLVLAMSLKKW